MTVFITLFIPLVGTSLGAAMVFLLKNKISDRTKNRFSALPPEL